MKRTNKYGLTIYEKGDFTSSIQEMQRFETLDNQLYALFKIIGNGVISGWNIIKSTGLSVVITSGSGHVFFIAVESKNAVTVALTAGIPANKINKIPAIPTRNYIYASLSSDSYWTKKVVFSSSTFINSNDDVLFLGYADTDENNVIEINTDSKKNLGFIEMVNNAIKTHRHIGGTENPSQINLAKDVQGQISQENLPDLNADVIKAGVLKTSVIPVLDHTTKLSDTGTLTHAQLDDFVNLLSMPDQSTMGEVSTSNLLQLILATKHIYPDIDENFVNEIAIIPGITPDNYIDFENTTAIVDTNTYSMGGSHTIKGTPSSGFTAYTKIWESEEEFSAAELSNLIVNGDSVVIDVKENTLIVDEFDDILQWQVVVQDSSSVPAALTADKSTYVVPPNSALLDVGNKNVKTVLKIFKQYDVLGLQDWSGYKYIKFSIKTESIEHGELFWYLVDHASGIQDSTIKILDQNAPTINIETLNNGWQEITINIETLVRTQIEEIGFYFSTQNGWDSSKKFNLNIDNMYLTSGNLYKDDGYIRFIFGNDFLYRFYRMRWESIIPTDIDENGVVSTNGANISVRTRVANSKEALSAAIWTQFYSINGYEIPILNGTMYKYIEIEFLLTSSYSNNRSPTLKKAYLDFYATDVDFSFSYSTKSDWDTGYKFNIDTNTYSNSISISNINEIGDYSYSSEGVAIQTNSSLTEKYRITGSMLPRSTYQVLNGIEPSFGTITGMAKGSNGNFWLSDVDNDRVVEVDRNGSLVTGFMGSFLNEPKDVYDTNSATEATSSIIATNSISNASSISILHSIYNYNDGSLYIICNSSLEDVYIDNAKLNLEKVYLKINSYRIYLNDSLVSLLGYRPKLYDFWKSNEKISQFVTDSHVLVIKPLGADRTLIDKLINQKMPSIVISSPLEQQMISGMVNVKFLLYNFELGASAGEQAIRITIDSGVPQIIYSPEISFTGLSTGKHIIKAELIQSDGYPFTNIEATVNGSFIINTGSYTLPYINFINPAPNQIYSSGVVTINFKVTNFPVVSNGQHLRYSIDNEAPVDYYSINPITITDLSSGKHTFNIYTVDVNGNTLSYTYSSATVEFIVGLNSNATIKLHVEQNAIYSISEEAFPRYDGEIDVGNIYLRNIYSPIDLQVNNNNVPITILVAKLRSQSWSEYIGGSANISEVLKRQSATDTKGTWYINTNGNIVNSPQDVVQANEISPLYYTNGNGEFSPEWKINKEIIMGNDGQIIANYVGNASSQTLTESLDRKKQLQNYYISLGATVEDPFEHITTSNLVYNTGYLDGHSVVELDSEGNTVFSNNDAKIAPSKEVAKIILGSCEKTELGELLIADSCNKRAILVETDLLSRKSMIQWEYNSDRYISDFHLVLQDTISIEIYDGYISIDNLTIRSGTSVSWINKSSSPISIWSGKTTYSDFYSNPDLNLYGNEFSSKVLEVGEEFVFKFNSENIYNWFVYPSILTGVIYSYSYRLTERDQYIILENDGLESAYGSRVLKVDSYGNILWSFGEMYLCKPRDARPLMNGNILIST